VKYLYSANITIGMMILIAENDEEALDLINQEKDLKVYANELMAGILTSQRFKLADDYESGIIDVLITE
tara:strand:+ start:220 stop:426 length:207 start_codon:yes stop_codon:yes gene_type:complete